jgi:hypothetical protein
MHVADLREVVGKGLPFRTLSGAAWSSSRPDLAFFKVSLLAAMPAISSFQEATKEAG